MRILLTIALFSVSTLVWSGTTTIDFEGVIETSDPVGGGGLPSKVITQKYQFYSAGGFLLSSGSGGNTWIANCPGCTTELQHVDGGLGDLKTLDISAAPPISGDGTVTLRGYYVEGDFVSVVLPLSSNLTAYSFGEDWKNLFSLWVISNAGGGANFIGLDFVDPRSGYEIKDFNHIGTEPCPTS